MKTYLYLLAIVFLLGSCENSESDINASSDLQVRIANPSDYDYHDLVFQNKEIGDIKKRCSTEYIDFDIVYIDLAYVKLKIDDITFTLQPIDYDAPEIKKGKCTFEIDVVDYENKILSLKTLVGN